MVINNAILHCRAHKGQDRHLIFTSCYYNSRRKIVILVSKERPECLGLAADISARSAMESLVFVAQNMAKNPQVTDNRLFGQSDT